MTDFTELGVHCAAEGCNQQDFLPFTCDCCKRTFCLSHRSYSAHSCPLAGDKDFRAFVCPLCNKTVRFIDSQDPNEQWELHRRRDCNPTAKKTPKQRCPAPDCREVLGPSNKQRCARCGQETCLTHRYPDSHPCLGGGSWKGGGSAAAANRRRREEAARPMSLREKAAQKAAVALSKDNTIRATADRRRREGNTGHGGAARASAGGGGAQQGSERCPQCGAVFGDVGSLVNHVESYHSGARQQRAPQRSQASGSSGSNSNTTGGGGASSTCPICNECFLDVNHLLSHMESAHPEPGDRLSHLGQGAKNCSVS